MAYTNCVMHMLCAQCPGSSGVEQRIENPRVGGSIPPPGTTFQKTLNLSFGLALGQALSPICVRWGKLKAALYR